ncbi:hypothetical protein Tcan_18907 [Toxocara canis]|uniref:Uncharacterized protein n=1 Tax=Toxocara canis TaxID=6265 RepID=A0A0B2VVU1_TOXCA|nr:hypothetical protein Tcan_18907 [Toxocara canis]
MPDPRRTRRMLSILIDYMQFSEEASKEVNRAFAAHDKKKAELEARRNAVVQKEHEIATLRSEHEYRKHDENEKSAELEQLCQKTRQTVQENASFQIRFQAIAKDISEKTKRIGELESELKSLTIHNEVLTSKLVTSPERLESEVKEAAERKEAAIKEFDVKRRELRAEEEKRRERAVVGNEIAKHEEQLQHIFSFEGELESELKSLTIHNEVLTSKLVTSPERLESEVKEAAERKEAAIKEFDVKRRELRAEEEKRRERAVVGNEIAKHEEQLQHIFSFEAKMTAMEEKLYAAKDLRSRLDDELTSLQNLIVKEQDAVKKCDMAFECERDNHVVQLRNYNEQLSTVGCHIAEMRRRLNEVNKENVVVQREIGKLKDSLSAMNRIAEAESIKIAHRFKGVMQKLNDARRAYDDEWRLFEVVLTMVAESRNADGLEHSDSISLRSKNHSTKSNLMED